MLLLDPVFSSFEKSGKTKIAVIGKGSSLDSIELDKLAEFFVININDSETIYPGDIGIYHYKWVEEFLSEQGGKCPLYVTSLPADNTNSLKVEHLYEGPEHLAPIQERFFDADFYLEDATIISALKLCNLISDYTRTKIPVYLLGFDFTLTSGYSKYTEGRIAFGEDNFIESLLNNQKAYLELILEAKKHLSIEIVHIGYCSFSSSTPELFNKKNFSKGMLNVRDTSEYKVPDREFNVQVIAEITTNHFGDLDLLKKMIISASESGADCIKLQKRNVSTFYSPEELAKPYSSPFGDTFGDYRRGLELDADAFMKVDQWCKEYGIKWFVSVLDIESYHFMKQFNPYMLKLPSTISEHKDLLELVAKEYKGAVVISTGMTDTAYEEYILNQFSNCKELYLLQCVSSYPTANEDANVGVVRHYSELASTYTNVLPGYSSHDIGSLCCQLAVAAGAVMVEKHVKYGNTPWAHFDNVAIDMLTDNFKSFVSDIRLAEVCTGSNKKSVLESEHHKYKISK
ncbi:MULTISPECIES: N-acetylneuraminate synthase family protein [Vibrio]|uniref:N-acetylneuraminate synthase family protein n=1 Tax=Vibrio TaxID=662 RepID=UPI0003085B40|nr:MULTISPECIES: N-acetylneuraminate synthase family protein [Vibrio]OEE96929.1 hypothetical protein A138_18955 [Vibrio crassostreae 9ZC77]PMK13554.1 hypothetical protein BCU07_06320 [Vibrio sp. 10N.261.54.E10]